MFSERLKELRMRHGYSQSELAKAIGVERTRYNKWEATGTEPSFAVLVKIADFFNVSTDYLLGRVDRPDEHFIQKEKLPADLAGSGYGFVVKSGSSSLTPEEVAVLKRLAAEYKPD